MFEYIDQIIADLDLNVCEAFDLPPRRQSRALIPEGLSTSPAARILPRFSPDGKLWKHQSLALKQLHAGRNVVVSTGTASGKSLIFQFYALHRLLMDPESKVLVFYPLRALASDQLLKWREIANLAGLRAKDVDRIDGSVAVGEREEIIEQARVVLMTPDVCQAWFMRTLGSQPVKRFLSALTLLILDEAHVYESVFGSNAAFLMRRLLAAKRRVSLQKGNVQLQVVAATATIAEPEEHLKKLTGLKFKVVSEKQDGAPRHERRILHIEGPDQGADGEQAIANIVAGICDLKDRRRFIAFMDSRQGVERIAQRVGKGSVKPYRSGYESRDRATIERALQSGALQGVVATSALELGIDIADMEIGVNLGVPQSRKSFRQRLGRIGRSSPAVFLVVAPPNAFTQFGERLPEYIAGSVEPAYLYLGNRFLQFAHARCLRDEMEALAIDSRRAPGGVNWPDGFPETLSFARGGRPREFDAIAQIGGDTPHFNYPLRQLGETKLRIQGASDIGDIALHQAIREAYPGANYLHLGRYRVHGWRSGFNEIIVRVSRAKNPVTTKPILRKSVTVDLSREGIVDGRIKRGENGILAEVQVQVTESVEGYRVGSAQHLYRDLRADDPNMVRKHRDFRTTGVLIRIQDDWFSQLLTREELSDGLRDLLIRDRSIAPQDIDGAHANIAVMEESGPRRTTGAVVIYDSVYGGLRLTENLFSEFDRYVERLAQAAHLAGPEAVVGEEIAKHLQDWAGTLVDSEPGLVVDAEQSASVEAPEGWLLVYKPGSMVGMSYSGHIVERELIGPVYRAPFGTGEPQLYYRYRHPRGADAFIPHEQVQSVGHEWEFVFWNPETDEIQELPDEAAEH